MEGKEIRHLLEQAHDKMANGGYPFSHVITVVRLPDSGAREVIVNTDQLQSKIEYLLNAYDEDMFLKANSGVRVVGAMVV